MAKHVRKRNRLSRVEYLEDRTLLSNFSFVSIADTCDSSFKEFGTVPALNNAGTVEFRTDYNGIFTGNGSDLTQIVSSLPLDLSLSSLPSLSDQGTVVFMIVNTRLEDPPGGSLRVDPSNHPSARSMNHATAMVAMLTSQAAAIPGGNRLDFASSVVVDQDLIDSTDHFYSVRILSQEFNALPNGKSALCGVAYQLPSIIARSGISNDAAVSLLREPIFSSTALDMANQKGNLIGIPGYFYDLTGGPTGIAFGGARLFFQNGGA